jgi:MFS transporter, SP family, general alpha glucoside:H+ symporter
VSNDLAFLKPTDLTSSALPWGFFAVAIPSYAAEICPLTLRGYLTTYVNLCWVMGHFIAIAVLIGLTGNTTQWAYRIPFAIQWVWPAPLFLIVYLAPESPWWLIRKGRVKEAEHVLNRLTTPIGKENTNIYDTIAMMQATTNFEREIGIGASYIACFQGSNLRRTEIAMVSWGSQVLTGWAMQGYITYFFELAGLSVDNSFKISLGMLPLIMTGPEALKILLDHLLNVS